MGKRCLVAVCHNLPIVYRQTAQSLMEMGWGNRVEKAKADHGFDAIDHLWITNWPRVDTLREEAGLAALSNGYDYVLFLDADMAWPSDVLWRMLKHAAPTDIVSGHYVQKAPPYGAVALLNPTRKPGSVVDEFEIADLRGLTEPVDVDVVGMGCCLVPVSVFATLPRPWFYYKPDDEGWPRITEDVAFCQAAKAVGYRVLVDPTIHCPHFVTQAIDPRWTNRYQLVAEETAKHTLVSIVPTGEGSAA